MTPEKRTFFDLCDLPMLPSLFKKLDEIKVENLGQLKGWPGATVISELKLTKAETANFIDCLQAGISTLSIDRVARIESSTLHHQSSAALVASILIAGCTGDIGGRDQAKLFAEISLDLIEAVQSEAMKRASQ